VSDTVGARRQHPEVGSWHKVDLDTHALYPASLHLHVPRYDPLGLYGCSDRLALCRLHSQPFVFTKPYYVCAVLDRGWAPPILCGWRWSCGGARPTVDLSIMHRRLVLSSVAPAAAAVLSRSALIGPPVNLV
jgi:hypothetical protein